MACCPYRGEIHASNARNLIPLTTGKVRGRGTRAGVRCGSNPFCLFVTLMGDVRWEDFIGADSGAGQGVPVISVPYYLKRPDVFTDDAVFRGLGAGELQPLLRHCRSHLHATTVGKQEPLATICGT